MSKRSTNIKASIQLENDEIDEYKRDVDPLTTNRRLYSPYKDPIVYVSKSTAENPARKRLSLSEDDFVPRESHVSSGKLYDPYTDQMINSWQETSYGQMQRTLVVENSEIKSRNSNKHLRTKSANESFTTMHVTNDKEIAHKEVTRQDPNVKALKLLTKELAQLENTISEASKRFNKYVNDDNNDSAINIYDESFWQKKISLHLSLANKYFKYIHLNYSLSVKNDIEAKCWKHGFYSLIDQFRNAVNIDRIRYKNRTSLSFVISDQFSKFLDEAESFYKRLLKQVSDDTKLNDKSIERNKPPKWIRCVCCLGDITRYRWAHGLEDKERTKEYWAENASRWYRLGIHLNSNNGKFYHHLAILAGQELRALYYYCRSLMVNTPFMNAREQLVVLFGRALDNIRQKPKGNRSYLQRDNLKPKNYLDNQPIENLFVRLHGMLFTKIGLEHFDETFQSFLDKLLKMNTIQNTNDSNHHWMEFYLFLAVVNLSGLYNYGSNENSTIGKAIKLQATGDIQSLDVDPVLAQESRLTFIIMNKFMLKYLEEYEIYQAGHDVSEGWLLYCEIIMLWMVASGVFDGFANGNNNSVWERIMRKSDFPGSWEIFARFLTNITHQISPLTKEKVLESVNKNTERDSFVQIQPPPLVEDWELRGISLLQPIYEHNLFERASKPNINFSNSEVESIFCDIEHNFILDQDEKTCRRIRIMELGYILTKKITGFDFDVKRNSFTVSSDLITNLESDEINDIVQKTVELFVEDDENDVLNYTEPNFEEVEFEEHNNEGIMELKSRRQELEALLAASRNNIHSSKAKSPAKKAKKVKRTASEKNIFYRIVPGYTTIIVDTNCLIGDLEIVKKIIQSEKWIVIVPSIVVTELDGLKFNPPPLGLAAHEALTYLNELLLSKKIKIQTSKGNYLTDISFSEEFDFGNGEDKKKNLDDLILGICLWHAKHYEVNDKSNEVGTDNEYKNEVVVLLTNDRNLRVKARARGVDVVGVKDFTGIV
ncbi:hypothetical protein C1645_781251 [Glomus cerebriforme]|uniref:PIN domain-containing protein n=1 Tax=Glomus cerebriforme TaxID=658196 RepID=A0A397SNT7_9GLOM|nr:hypothetical protein C1645_781251 [Glomus cerebriforme]